MSEGGSWSTKRILCSWFSSRLAGSLISRMRDGEMESTCCWDRELPEAMRLRDGEALGSLPSAVAAPPLLSKETRFKRLRAEAEADTKLCAFTGVSAPGAPSRPPGRWGWCWMCWRAEDGWSQGLGDCASPL
eukprot:CAMPEP_0185205426 /NCGR_PEP_ID=MMETSP1140-20130426/56623_1 /TAXON_ID=298111 /ORGANISM="Pavlova sp., Strain CCMP459" /LENGTH=131 /DNA_ID=CAMNT_0027773027 /DNA_START=175 /DNA_END=567 /DNA_ORIENTATION=-